MIPVTLPLQGASYPNIAPDNAGSAGLTIGFAANQIASFTTMTQLYRKFRIMEVRVKASLQAGYEDSLDLHYIKDIDGELTANAGLTPTHILNAGPTHITLAPGIKPYCEFRIKKPGVRTVIAATAGGQNVLNSGTQRGPWLNTQSSGINHYGMVFMATNLMNNTAAAIPATLPVTFTADYILEFKELDAK